MSRPMNEDSYKRVKPVSHYFGGKSEFIDFYIDHTPRDGIKTGVEVCGGMAAWTLAREPFANDVINDRYEFIADLFTEIRDHPKRLAKGLSATPYSLAEWNRCRNRLAAVEADRRAGNPPREPVSEIARMYLTVLRQSLATAPGESWSRVIDHSRRGMCSSCSRWIDAPDSVLAVADRLKSVQIESLGFAQCIAKYDRPTTLFFIDPPYVGETRTGGAKTYQLEFTKADHVQLIGILRRVRAKVMLCGYAHPLYDNALTPDNGWRRVVYEAHARTNVRTDGSNGRRATREEILWIKG